MTWWQRHPESVTLCSCGVPVQRTVNGTLREGMAQHIRTVHGGQKPELAEATGAGS